MWPICHTTVNDGSDMTPSGLPLFQNWERGTVGEGVVHTNESPWAWWPEPCVDESSRIKLQLQEGRNP